jgi:hypothetical protein
VPSHAADWVRRAVIAAVILTVGHYYLWGVRAAGYEFVWDRDHGGYYNYLGRALASGRLYLPIDSSIEMHDMALYQGRYYLYHGAAPALFLFAPWRLLTGHDLPENFALFLMCFGGFVFSCAALLRILASASVTPSPAVAGALLLSVGLCQSIPYLLNRAWVYEVAISGGYFCLSAAFCFLIYGLTGRMTSITLAISGWMFGMAMACRPHLGFAAAAVLASFLLLRLALRQYLAFLGPFGAAGLLIGAYNYARFGDPFDFGIQYLITGPDQNRIKLAVEYLLPGLYYFLFCAPDLTPVFPWVSMVFRYPFNSASAAFPAGYVVEATTGALYLAPVLCGLLLIGLSRGIVRLYLSVLVASSAAIVAFLAATGWTTQRYEIDFLPPAVLAATAAAGIAIAQTNSWKRTALTSLLMATVAFGVVVNLALGIAGPYHEMLKNRPARFVTIAGWFSPLTYAKPLLNPVLVAEFTARFTPRPDGTREPLLTAGHQALRYFLIAEHRAGTVEIISRTDESAQQHSIAAGAPVAFRVAYAPESGNVTIDVNGARAITHHVGALVTARAQITPGENRIDPNVSAPRFSGALENVSIVAGPTFELQCEEPCAKH